MGENTKIEWAHHTFNPWIGCSKVSPGCKNCYAEAMMANRLGKVEWGPHGTRIRTSESNWRQPLKWNRKAEEKGIRYRVFCASLADVFEDQPELVPWRNELFDLIEDTPNLDWLLLTKRPENVLQYAYSTWIKIQSNLWIGTSIENQEQANKRIPELLKIPAAVRFLSMEPLLGPVDLWGPNYRIGNAYQGAVSHWPGGVDWVIVGGESGPNARPMHPDWARSLRDQCQAAGVPFFFKQWGEWGPITQLHEDLWNDKSITLRHDGEVFLTDEPQTFCCNNCRSEDAFRVGKHTAGRLLDGVEHNQFPEVQP